MSRSLFLLKLREDYNTNPAFSGSPQIATGMWNSAQFVVDALTTHGREAEVLAVVDGNSIDAAVTGYNPTHIFIEGLWVTPAKLAELQSLARHAGRTWVVRVHSELPFLATEGVAMDWLSKYMLQGVKVAPNSERVYHQLVWLAGALGITNGPSAVLYLPNCFPTDDFQPVSRPVLQPDKPTLDIGLFGAFRPLKNHLLQAFIALKFAEQLGRQLRLHVNTRIDQGGTPVANNVTALINAVPGAEIVNHPWEDRPTFLATIAGMDVVFQDSISETFNIVAADAIWVGRPVLASDEVPWIYELGVDTQSVEDGIRKMHLIWRNPQFFIQKNRQGLQRFVRESERIWLHLLR